MLGSYYGFFSDWELRGKVTFDGPNKLIIVNPDVTSISIQTDVYSGWKRWMVASANNSGFDAAIRTIGGDPTISGQRAGDIYFLINGWRLVIDFAQTGVSGILFSDDFATAYYRSDLTPQSGVQVSSTVNTVETPVNVVTGDLSTVPTAAEIAAAVKALTLQQFLALKD